MEELTNNYTENVKKIDAALKIGESFDIIKRTLSLDGAHLTLYFVDGMVKDTALEKMFQYFFTLTNLDNTDARTFVNSHVPTCEVQIVNNTDDAVFWVLSGAALMLGSRFSSEAAVLDVRTYPSRETQEPDNDKVMQGAKYGFVETLLTNTSLIRRRIRDPNLTMTYRRVTSSSRADVVICYMKDRADPDYVKYLCDKIDRIDTKSLSLGYEALAESLITKRWYNPFPKIRTVERPDAAASELMEGRVLIMCDTSPRVMVLPTFIFDFMQETNDFCFPPLTGAYLRVVRHFVFWLSLFLTPLWYLLITYPEVLPASLSFIVPRDSVHLPIIIQLFLVEFAIDGLKIASMNTPDMMSGSLSVIGGLILGDAATKIGWFSSEVIFYMAIVAIAGFTQHNYELGYSFKFLRMMILALTGVFGVWGFAAGAVVSLVFLISNRTVNAGYSYLYPIFPFNFRAFMRLFFRLKKRN